MGILPTEKIRLGLDLQGGMHLILEVQVDKAVDNRVERTAEELRDAMRKAGIRYKNLDRVKDTQIVVQMADQENVEAFDNMLDKEFPFSQISR